MNPPVFALISVVFAAGLAQTILAQDHTASSSTSPATTSIQQERLNGQVRRVRLETVALLVREGKVVEGPRVLREITTYDQKGQKIDSIAYPEQVSTVVGTKQYLRDAKGNPIEMTLRGSDGSVLNKEKYEYQFDELGNWKKMTASMAVIENGNVGYEPFEITYRTITYFYVEQAPKVITSPNVTPPISSSGQLANAGGTKKSSKPSEPAPNGGGINGTPREAATKISDTAQSATSKRENGVTPINQTATLEDNKSDPPPRLTEETLLKTASKSDGSASDSNAVSVESSPANAKPITDSVKPQPSDSNASALIIEGRNTEAAVLKEAVARNPNDAAAYAKLGKAYAGLKQYQEAVNALKSAIRIKPEVVDAEGYYHLSNSYNALRKFSQALDAIKQAVYIKRAEEVNADGTNSLNSPPLTEMLYLAGIINISLRRYSGAVEELRKVIASNPKHANAHYALGLCYLANGERRSAERQLKTLESLNPVYAAQFEKLIASNSNSPRFGFIFKTNP